MALTPLSLFIAGLIAGLIACRLHAAAAAKISHRSGARTRVFGRFGGSF
jgi:hypothetical protein